MHNYKSNNMECIDLIYFQDKWIPVFVVDKGCKAAMITESKKYRADSKFRRGLKCIIFNREFYNKCTPVARKVVTYHEVGHAYVDKEVFNSTRIKISNMFQIKVLIEVCCDLYAYEKVSKDELREYYKFVKDSNRSNSNSIGDVRISVLKRYLKGDTSFDKMCRSTLSYIDSSNKIHCVYTEMRSNIIREMKKKGVERRDIRGLMNKKDYMQFNVPMKLNKAIILKWCRILGVDIDKVI